MVEHIANAEVIAIARKIVPLVNVNAIPFVCHYLESQQARKHYTDNYKQLSTKIICSYYTTKYAKLPKNCDVSFAIGELHQAYGHVMLPMST